VASKERQAKETQVCSLLAIKEASYLERAFFTALRLAGRLLWRDSPLRFGIPFKGVGGPAKAPRKIVCSRCCVV